MSNKQQTAKIIKAEPSKDSSDDDLPVLRTTKGRLQSGIQPLTCIQRKRTFSKVESPEFLEGASDVAVIAAAVAAYILTTL